MTTIAPADSQTLAVDSLISDLEHAGESHHQLALEHLRAARTYILGSMPEEYSLNLEFAQKAASDIQDSGLRHRVLDSLSNLRSEAARLAEERRRPAHHGPPPAGITDERGPLAKMFEGSPTLLGVFYPKHFVICVFPSYDAARHATAALWSADFTDQDAVAVPGWQMVQFFEYVHSHGGLFADLAAEFSRFIDTEVNLEDREARLASRGAAFLAVYAPDEAAANRIRDVVVPFEPMMIVWYMPYFIRHLI